MCAHTQTTEARNNSTAGVPVCMLTTLAFQSKSENSCEETERLKGLNEIQLCFSCAVRISNQTEAGEKSTEVPLFQQDRLESGFWSLTAECLQLLCSPATGICRR